MVFPLQVVRVCTTVPCDAVCYSVVQSKNGATTTGVASMGKCTLCCSVLQRDAASCSMLQRVVVCHSVFQCVAVCNLVCCSVVFSAF